MFPDLPHLSLKELGALFEHIVTLRRASAAFLNRPDCTPVLHTLASSEAELFVQTTENILSELLRRQPEGSAEAFEYAWLVTAATAETAVCITDFDAMIDALREVQTAARANKKDAHQWQAQRM